MTETVLIALIAVLGPALGAAAVWYGKRKETSVQHKTIEAAAYERAMAIWDDAIADLKDQVADQRVRITQQSDEMAKLRGRLEAMEEQRAADRTLLREIRRYANQLAEMLRDTGQHPPTPPHGLDMSGG